MKTIQLKLGSQHPEFQAVRREFEKVYALADMIFNSQSRMRALRHRRDLLLSYVEDEHGTRRRG
jgi:hypothetical protein